MSVAKGCILLGTGVIAAVAGAFAGAGAAPVSALAITGSALGNIGASYAGDAFKPAFEQVSDILRSGGGSDALPLNHDLMRALRRSHLDGLTHVLAEFEAAMLRQYKWSRGWRGFNARPFVKAARGWIAAQLALASAPDLYSAGEYEGALSAAGKVIQGAHGPNFDTVRGGQDSFGTIDETVARDVADEAWNEFVAAMEESSHPVPQAFEPYFYGPEAGPWVRAAQSFFAHRLKTDASVRTVVESMRFAANREQMDAILKTVRDREALLGERFDAIEATLARIAEHAEPGVPFDIAELAAAMTAKVASGAFLEDLANQIAAKLAAGYGVEQTALQSASRHARILDQPFFGRVAELHALDAFAASDRPGLMMVTAPAGGGKSTLLANWIEMRRARGEATVRHFITNLEQNTTGPAEIAGHLISQVRATRLIEAAGDGGRREELFTLLQSHSEPLVLVLDGLDEAASTIERFIEAKLPANVKVVISGRADRGQVPDYLRALSTRGEPGPIAAYLKPWARLHAPPMFVVSHIEVLPLGASDIEWWLEDYLGHVPGPEMAELARQLHRSTDGLPIFLAFVMDDLAAGTWAPMDSAARRQLIARLPAPFARYLRDEIEREPRRQLGEPAWTRPVQRLFGLLTRTKGAIRVSEIEAVFGDLTVPDLADLHHRFTRWLAISGVGGDARMAFAHPRLAIAFAEAMPAEAEEMGARLLAWQRREAERAATTKALPPEYVLDWFGSHLVEDGEAMGAAAADLLSDPGFLLQQLEDSRAASRRLERSLANWYAIAPDLRASQAARAWTAFWGENETQLTALARRQGLGTPIARIIGACLGDRGFENPDHRVKARAMRARRAARSALLRSIGNAHKDGVLEAWLLGKRLLSLGREGLARLWDAGTLEPLSDYIDIPWSGVREIVAIGDWLVTGGADGTLRLWDIATLEPRSEAVAAHEDGVRGILRLGTRLLSHGGDGRIRLWNAATLALLAETEGDRYDHDLKVLPIGNVLVSYSSGSGLKSWDAETLTPLAGPIGAKASYGDIDHIEAVGDRILTYGWSGELQLRDPLTLEPVTAPVKAHNAHIGIGGVLNLGSRLLSYGAIDDDLRLWDAASLAPLGDPVTFAPGGLRSIVAIGDRLLAYGSETLQLLDAATVQPSSESVEAGVGLIWGVLVLGDRILAYGSSGRFSFWDAATLAPIGEVVEARVGGVLHVLQAGRYAISYGARELRLWDPSALQDASESSEYPPGDVYGTVALGGKLLTYGGGDAFRQLDTATLEPIVEPSHAPEGFTWGLAPSGDHLVSYGADGKIQLWDMSTLQPLSDAVEAHRSGARGVLSFGERLVSYGHDGTLRLWDAATLAQTGDPVTAHGGSQWRAFALGDCVASYSWHEPGIFLWDAATLKLRASVAHAHAKVVAGLIPVAHGLLSYGTDGIRLWDPLTLDPLLPLAEVDGGVAEMTAVGDLLLSLSNDGKIQFRNLATLVPRSAPMPSTMSTLAKLVPLGTRILAYDWNGGFELWDTKTLGPCSEPIEAHAGRIGGVVPLGDYVISFGDDGTLRFWDSATLTPIETIAVPGGELRVAAPSGDAIAVFGASAFLYPLPQALRPS